MKRALAAAAGLLLAGLLLWPAWAGEAVLKVRAVFDGDTLALADGTRVRLIGLDAPEMGREGRPDQPFAPEAKARLEKLVGSGRLRLELDQERRDRHGRTLAWLFSGQSLISEILLEEGLARCLIIGPNTRYAERLIEAERRARAAGRGLWRDWKSR